jgi:hypothetical protein
MRRELSRLDIVGGPFWRLAWQLPNTFGVNLCHHDRDALGYELVDE